MREKRYFFNRVSLRESHIITIRVIYLRRHTSFPRQYVGTCLVDWIIRCTRRANYWSNFYFRIPCALYYPLDFLVRIHYYSLHLTLTVSRKIWVRYVLQMALDTFLMIYNIHITALINPQFSNYNIMYCSCNFTPCIMLLPIVEFQMGSTQRNYLIVKINYLNGCIQKTQ